MLEFENGECQVITDRWQGEAAGGVSERPWRGVAFFEAVGMVHARDGAVENRSVAEMRRRHTRARRLERKAGR
eukprot:15386265-Alexandrium_andersonii.AAC.1